MDEADSQLIGLLRAFAASGACNGAHRATQCSAEPHPPRAPSSLPPIYPP